MGASIYILIENAGDISAHELPTIDGKGIAKNWAMLSTAARAANVKPLDDFVSVNREELTALIGEDVSQESAIQALKEHWFQPTDGLTTTRYLISHVRENQQTFDKPTSLLNDLRHLEKNLSFADSKKLRFRLAWDF